jgi:hypothetical protein
MPMSVVRCPDWHPSEFRYRLFVYPNRNFLYALWRTTPVRCVGDLPRDRNFNVYDHDAMMFDVSELRNGITNISYAQCGENYYLGKNDCPLHTINHHLIRHQDIERAILNIEKLIDREPDCTFESIKDDFLGGKYNSEDETIIEEIERGMKKDLNV